ncbi:MAG: DUF4476 domain-containing protein [Chitinophagaceae bacterium]
MKTIFTLLTSTLMSVSLLAADIKPTGSVFVRSSDNSTIRVVLDGKRFEPNTSSVIISGLDQGNHNVTVYKQKSTAGYNKPARFEMIYNGSVNVKRRTDHIITIGRNNKVTFKETRNTGQVRGNQGDHEYNYNDGQWNGDDNGGYSSGMNSRDFDRILQSIDKEWLEGNKIKSATQVVRTNALSVAQVKQLVQLFTFENNKLELAKQAYGTTVDKRNYYMISDLLTFNASKAELEKYIRNFR